MGARRSLARRRASSARRTRSAPRKSQTGKIAKEGRYRRLIYQPDAAPVDRHRVPCGGSESDRISERVRQHAIRIHTYKISGILRKLLSYRPRQRSQALAMPRLLPPDPLAREAKDRSTSSRPATVSRVAPWSRMTESSSSKSESIFLTENSSRCKRDRSPYRAPIAVVHVANTSLATSSRWWRVTCR